MIVDKTLNSLKCFTVFVECSGVVTSIAITSLYAVLVFCSVPLVHPCKDVGNCHLNVADGCF